MSPRPRIGSAAIVVLSAVLAGCASARVVERPLPGGLEWPPGEPRVRLERVIAFQRSGGPLSWLGGQGEVPLFQRPYGLAWQGDDLLVADPGARKVVRIGADGGIGVTSGAAVGGVLAVAVCGDSVVTADPELGRVALLAPDLSLVRWLAEDLSRPTGVACGGDRVFVVETGRHRVLLLDADGSQRTIGRRGTELGQFNFPTALAVHGDTLLVGDTLNFRVQRLAAGSGRALGTFGRLGDAAGDMPRIKGLAADAAGHVWVSDAHTDRVSLYDAEGGLLLSLGGTGSAPGQFSFPTGVAAHPDGRVAVADSFNRRVVILRVATSGGPLR